MALIRIDHERTKVTDDLLFTSQIEATSLVSIGKICNEPLFAFTLSSERRYLLLRISRAVRGIQIATILWGREIDQYLESFGALAQAISAGLILASSALDSLTPHQRQLVYLHEFAHLEQLAHDGQDSMADLETEAWRAAQCWSRGIPFTVRGRASAPLNALALIQGGRTGHPSAPPWYQANPSEPISSTDKIVVKDVKVIDDMTLDSVLDAIIAAQASEVIVVCHGDSDGLMLRTHSNASAGADRTVLTALGADHRGEDVGFDGMKIVTPIKSDDDVKDLMKTNLAQVAVLRKKMNTVRAMKLNHIAFRACSMGSSDESMKAFLQFFGCASISAPTLEDTYGSFAAKPTPDFDGWVKNTRKAMFHVFSDGKVAIATKWAGGINYRIDCRGTNRSEIAKWVKKHVVTGSFDPANVVFHGMKIPDGIMPLNQTNIYFILDADFTSRISFVKA